MVDGSADGRLESRIIGTSGVDAGETSAVSTEISQYLSLNESYRAPDTTASGVISLVDSAKAAYKTVGADLDSI